MGAERIECPACGGLEDVEGVCRDCGLHHAAAQTAAEALEPTFVWRRREDGDFELVRANSAGVLLARGNLKQFSGRRASDVYADDPDSVEALRAAAERREVVVQRRPYRLLSTGEEHHVVAAFRPACRDLILVTVLDHAPVRR